MEKKKLKKKGLWPSNDELRTLESNLTVLQNFAAETLKPTPIWQRGLSFKEKRELLSEISRAKASLWNTVYHTYPETVGKHLSFKQDFIVEL